MRAKTKKWFSPLFVLTLAVAGIFGVSAAVVDKQASDAPVVEKADADDTKENVKSIVLWAKDEVGWTTGGSHSLYIKFNSLSHPDNFYYKNSFSTFIGNGRDGITKDGSGNYYRTMDWDGSDGQSFIWHVPWYINGFNYTIGQTGTSEICPGKNNTNNWNSASKGNSGEYHKDYVCWWGGNKTFSATTSADTAETETIYYTVTHTLNSGTGVAASQKVYQYGIATNPGTPTRSNYDFVKWGATNSQSATTVDFSVEITANKIIYAIWTGSKYTITLDNQSATTTGTGTIYEKYNDGFYLDSACTSQKMSTSANGISTPTKTNNVFGGYYTGPSGSGTKYIDENGKLTSSASSTNFTGAGTLYAKWTAETTYTVTASVDSSCTGYGTVSGSPVSGIRNGTAYTVSSNTITVGTYGTITATATAQSAQYSYAFVKWTDSSGNTLSSGTISSADLSVKAVFSRTTRNYNVTIQSNNSSYGKIGNVASVVVSIPYGTTYTTSSNVLTLNNVNYTATPTAQSAEYNYSFTSWSSSSGTITGVTTITATFSRTNRSYDLTYKYVDTEGNVIKTATVASTAYYTSKTLPTPTVSGYKYKTWHDGDGVSGTNRAIGYSFRMPAANTTYTAEFERVGGYLVGLDGDFTPILTASKYMSDYGETNYVYKNVSLTVGNTFIVYQVPTSGDNTWHGYGSVNGGDAVDDFKYATEGYDHIEAKVTGVYDIVLNTSTGKVYLYRKGSGTFSAGYYMVGTGTFASGTTPTWAFANGIKMSTNDVGDNIAKLESASGTSVAAGSIFKIAQHTDAATNEWFGLTRGANYDFATESNGEITITKAGNYNFYFKDEDNKHKVFIVDVGSIELFGYLYFSSNETAGNIRFTSKLANGDVVVNNQPLSSIAAIEVTSKVASFDGKQYLYKFPIYNLRGNQGGAAVTQVVYNDGTETTVTGIPTNATDTPHYYAREGAANLANGKAAQAIFDIDAALYNKGTGAYVSVCTLSQETASTLKSEYDAATSAGSSLHSSATINTYATVITDPTKANVSVALIYTQIAAIATTGSPANSIRSFSPYSLIIGEEGDNTAVILIIIASSISILSITALSVLMVKKKKSANK